QRRDALAYAERRHFVFAAASAIEIAADPARSIADARAAVSRSTTAAANGAVLVTRRAADVQRRAVRWLWQNRIPRGMVTLLVGPPKVGKSVLTSDIVARVTRGTSWPDGAANPSGPSTALVVNTEDLVAEVQRPRLEAAGADLERVVFV